MPTVLTTRIVKIGNSQGVKIAKIFLEAIRLREDVALELQPDQFVIRSARRAGEGWERAFQALAEQGDDRLLEADCRATRRVDMVVKGFRCSPSSSSQTHEPREPRPA